MEHTLNCGNYGAQIGQARGRGSKNPKVSKEEVTNKPLINKEEVIMHPLQPYQTLQAIQVPNHNGEVQATEETLKEEEKTSLVQKE
jgi:hypothetical protein